MNQTFEAEIPTEAFRRFSMNVGPGSVVDLDVELPTTSVAMVVYARKDASPTHVHFDHSRKIIVS